jgi:hypothetical protein
MLQAQPARALVYSPAYTTTSAVGAYTATSVSSSFGFFFETTSNVDIGALGFAAQLGWGNGATYTVKLWSYTNGGGSPTDYTELATATFTHGTAYDIQDDYYWSPLASVVTLPDSFNTDPQSSVGYVIAAVGDFSNAPGNVQFETGTSNFDSRFLNVGNGFNDATDPNGFFGVPIYDGAVGTAGFFNANLASVVSPSTASVPGPLALGGAVAAFGWSRRLRRRVQPNR